MSKLDKAPAKARPLEPGDVLTIPVRDNIGGIIKTIQIVRTSRDFVFDLCDAYNAARSDDALDRGIEWFVGPGGELKVGIADSWSRSNRRQVESRAETERAIANRRQLEQARSERT